MFLISCFVHALYILEPCGKTYSENIIHLEMVILYNRWTHQCYVSITNYPHLTITTCSLRIPIKKFLYINSISAKETICPSINYYKSYRVIVRCGIFFYLEALTVNISNSLFMLLQTNDTQTNVFMRTKAYLCMYKIMF